MFTKALISSICIVFLIQTVMFSSIMKSFAGENLKSSESKDIVLRNEMEEIRNLDTQTETTNNNEIWMCVNYFMGGNITPAIVYKREFWRLFTAFFLHENIFHFLFNILIILTYLKDPEIEENQIMTIFLPVLLNANLFSSLIYPDHLKIGSSMLNYLLFGISITNIKRFPSITWILNALMGLFTLFSFLNTNLDLAVHFFGFISGLFWVFCNRTKSQSLFFGVNILVSVLFLVLLLTSNLCPEREFAAQLNFGCGYVYETPAK